MPDAEVVTWDETWAGPDDCRPSVYRSQIEKDIWYSVVVGNEYRLGQLAPDDVVLDIGAHIGSFSWLAHRNGSRRILAFEPDPWHLEAARANLHGLEGVTLFPGAVVRSDKWSKAEYHYNLGEWHTFSKDGPIIATRSLDEILKSVGPVRFIKIDCEGGEWPILYTCTMLDHVAEIAGEFHLSTVFEDESLPPKTIEALQAFLESNGFSFSYEQEHDPLLGLFWAKR